MPLVIFCTLADKGGVIVDTMQRVMWVRCKSKNSATTIDKYMIQVCTSTQIHKHINTHWTGNVGPLQIQNMVTFAAAYNRSVGNRIQWKG